MDQPNCKPTERTKLENAIIKDPLIYQFLEFKYRNDKLITIIAFDSHYGSLLEFSSKRLKDCRNVVIQAITTSRGHALQYASNRLRNDREIALLVANYNPVALYTTLYNYSHDRELMLIAININPHILADTNELYKNDEQIIRLAVSNKGKSIKYASEYLKSNREIALIAVTQKGNALKYLKNYPTGADEEIVLAAIKQNAESFIYIHESLKNDVVFIEKAIMVNSLVISYIDNKLTDYIRLVQIAVSNNLFAISCIFGNTFDKINIDFNKHTLYITSDTTTPLQDTLESDNTLQCNKYQRLNIKVILLSGTQIEIDETHIYNVNDIIEYLKDIPEYRKKTIKIIYDSHILDKSTRVSLFDEQLEIILTKLPIQNQTSFQFVFHCIISEI